MKAHCIESFCLSATTKCLLSNTSSASNPKEGLGKPETFRFLGFTMQAENVRLASNFSN
jgi:hypothetical protein